MYFDTFYYAAQLAHLNTIVSHDDYFSPVIAMLNYLLSTGKNLKCDKTTNFTFINNASKQNEKLKWKK